ncbi:TonB-dependent receptor [Solilutibacter silvestris]|uniref:TonB-dependent receptor n=1 Tax=Solilutibacter silvestris TaxID=1645665 RepID=UPI003D345D8E
MSSNSIRSGFKRSALTVALGLCFAGTVHAQATTGTVFGNAAPGETITVVSDTGFARTVNVDSSGRYSIGSLPVGNYTITAKKGDQVVGTKQVLVKVSAGTEASFAGAQASGGNELGTITVTGAGSTIDVTQVDSRSVITAKELAILPVARSAESVALLAPGVIQGSGNVGTLSGRSTNTVSFGGSGITENAYYINGYNSTDPLMGLGGVGLPYGSIAQQETYIGGYSAMYGRSDGGVINQVGKRGTKDWHFGGQIIYAPKAWASAPKDVMYPNNSLPAGHAYSDPTLPGTIFSRGADQKTWSRTYSAYVGGPLVPDKLFFFLSAENEQIDSMTRSNSAASIISDNKAVNTRPKVYLKLDWNINSNNIVELTGIKNSDNVRSDNYAYDYATGKEGAFQSKGNIFKNETKLYVGKYTSYLSDDLTLNVTYGKSVLKNPVFPGVYSSLPQILGPANQNPAYLPGGVPIRNGQTVGRLASGNAEIDTHGLRIDLSYRLGNHTFAGGIDNMYYEAYNQGQTTGGPGYRWEYNQTSSPTDPISTGLGVPAPNSNYYVDKLVQDFRGNMSVDQTAYYLEDAWQIRPNFLLKLGIRNDRFINKNNIGQAYVDERNQFAPRVGFSWDVKSDSTMKVYGNVGRYYLALPSSVAIRGASASTYTREYFNYTGIDANGAPTGLTPIGTTGPVSANQEYGTPVDPHTVAARSLKAQYQDEFILGFDQALSAKWSWGAKGTLRMLRTAIDDFCDTQKIADKMDASGMNSALYDIKGCYIFNPGRDNTFQVNRLDGSGSALVTTTNADLGFTEGAKRKYVGLDLYLEHPFDGKWQARLDYTWSRSTGNSEGQVKSDTGQNDVSKTTDWDAATLMEYASGTLQNDRRHQLKLRGMYQFARDWMVTGTVLAQSGTPKNCMGYYGPNETDPIGYGSFYHWCNGTPSTPGSAGRTPWTKKLNLGVIYRPLWAEKKLTFAFDVFNVLNDRNPTSVDPIYEDGPHSVSNTYGMGTTFQTPRTARLTVSYDY